jgi:hypothetical protein
VDFTEIFADQLATTPTVDQSTLDKLIACWGEQGTTTYRLPALGDTPVYYMVYRQDPENPITEGNRQAIIELRSHNYPSNGEIDLTDMSFQGYTSSPTKIPRFFYKDYRQELVNNISKELTQ